MTERARDLRVSLGAPSAEVLDARLRLVDAAGCRAELRLDLLPEGVDLARLVRDFPRLDLLAAWPRLPGVEGSPARAAQGARRAGASDGARVAGLRAAAEAGVPWIDVPLELADAELPVTRRVWSWHQSRPSAAATAAAGTVESGHGVPQPGTDALARACEALQELATAEDVCKVVAWADGAEQAFDALALAADAADPRLLAFAMGPGGEASRLLCLRHGAPWTYAGWRGAATAAGQAEWQAALGLLPDGDGPLCGVVGDPVAHSLSPQLWRAAWAAGAGGSGCFVRFRALDFGRFLERAERYGVDLLAVTAPFKEAALAAAAEADEVARRCGAANLLLRRGGAAEGGSPVDAEGGSRADGEGGWRAGNTDGAGAMDALAAAGMPPDAQLLVVGAGGAARAAAAEALARGHAVTVAARRAEAQLETARRLDRIGRLQTRGLPMAPDALQALDGAVAIVQATPVGSSAQPGDALAEVRLPRDARVLDMVYAPPRTALLARAAAEGAVPVPGSAMLLHQMRAQYARLHGAPPPLAPLQQALDGEAARRAGIVLLGMRGAGKSTLGRWLAAVLGVPFTDADDAYAERHGRSVAEDLEADLPGFRAREAELLAELLDAQADCGGGVLATGGGAVLEEASRARLQRHSGTLLLDAPAAVLCARQAADPRPRLHAGSLLGEVETLLVERAGAYAACARARIDVGGDEADARARLLEWAQAAGHAGFRA